MIKAVGRIELTEHIGDISVFGREWSQGIIGINSGGCSSAGIVTFHAEIILHFSYPGF
jgi:hypothetical protein